MSLTGNNYVTSGNFGWRISIMGWIQKNLVNCTDPRKQGKGLTANRSGEWRYRIGDYRLISDINDEIVTILMLEIGHRKDIYK